MDPRLPIALLLLAAACSKTEPVPAPSSSAKSKTSVAAPSAPAPSADGAPIDAATRERLARQEAAVKMFEKKNETGVLQPPPPRSAIAAAPVEAPRPAAAEPAPPKPAPAEAKPAPAPATQAPTPAPRQEPAAPPKVASAAPPAEAKAAARPAPAPAPSRETRLLTRVEPEFPAEAARAGVDQGAVRARLTLDASGKVTRVDIVDATPRRVFDRAVTRALSQWRYNEGEDGRSTESEILFRR